MCWWILLIFYIFMFIGCGYFYLFFNYFASIHTRIHFLLISHGFNCCSLGAPSAHSHYINQTTPSVCSLPKYAIRHVHYNSSVWSVYGGMDCWMWTVQKNIFNSGTEVIFYVHLSGAGIDSCTQVQRGPVSVVRFLKAILMSL